uniref:Uncharacterized protein n=1 Tax=Zea mays TaxID=4577 RepID=B6SMR4_MAIZE|nr:hypothetical protein [Zea mays]
MFLRHASSLATYQRSITTTAPWLLNCNGGLHFSENPDVVILPPFLIQDLPVLFPPLLSLGNWNGFNLNLFVCVCTCSVCFIWRSVHSSCSFSLHPIR